MNDSIYYHRQPAWPLCLLFLKAKPLINNSLQRLSRQEVAQIFCKEGIVPFPEFIGDGGSMWSDKAVFQRPIGRTCWQWLFGKNVEGRAGNLLLLQSGDQRVIVNQWATAHVDEKSR